MANEITSTQVAQAIAKIVAGRALAPLVGNLVMGNLVNRDYEQTLGQVGDVVNVPIPPTLSANNIAEAGTVTNQGPNLGNAQIVLSRHVESTFVIPDVTRMLASPNLIDVYMQPAIIAVTEDIESSLANLYTLFTANTAVGAGTAFDEARLDAAEKALFDAKVPRGTQLHAMLSSGAWAAARQIARFTEFQTVGPTGQPSPMVTGGLPGGSGNDTGMLKGIMLHRSQYVAATSTTTFHNLIFARDAIGLVIRRLPQPLPGTGAIAEYAEMGNFGVRVVMSYQPNTLAQQFTVDCLYGCGVLRNNFGIDCQSL